MNSLPPTSPFSPQTSLLQTLIREVGESAFKTLMNTGADFQKSDPAVFKHVIEFLIASVALTPDRSATDTSPEKLLQQLLKSFEHLRATPTHAPAPDRFIKEFSQTFKAIVHQQLSQHAPNTPVRPYHQAQMIASAELQTIISQDIEGAHAGRNRRDYELFGLGTPPSRTETETQQKRHRKEQKKESRQILTMIQEELERLIGFLENYRATHDEATILQTIPDLPERIERLNRQLNECRLLLTHL